MKKKGLSVFLAFSLLAASIPVYGGELSDGSGDVWMQTEPENSEAAEGTEDILSDGNISGGATGSAQEIPDIEEAPDTEEIPDEEEIPGEEGNSGQEELLEEFSFDEGIVPDQELPEEEILQEEETSDLLEDGEASRELSDGVDISELTGESGGTAGEKASISYSFDEATGTLTLTGKGRMPDYNGQNMAPWSSYSNTAKKIVVGEGITYLGEVAFWEFDSAQTAVLPSTLKEIGTAAFGNCSSLTEVNLPEGLEKINDYAFQNTYVESIRLPSTLKELSALFAWGCCAQEVTAASGNPFFASSDGVLFTKDMTKLLYYPRKRPGNSYTIPESVKTVGENAFIEAEVLQITIPSSVAKLETGCFSGSWIEALVIPDSVKEMGDYICESCTKLVSVQIGNGLKGLGYRAFYGAYNLEKVKFGKGLAYIDQLAFGYCGALRQIVIPEGVEYIKNGAFGECGLESVQFPSTLKEIWYQGFFNCSNLKEIAFPEGLRAINRLAFYGTGIKKVTLPKSVTFVGEEAFPNGTEITRLNGDLETDDDGSMRESYDLPLEVKYDYTSAFQVLDLVNKERKKRNLPALTMDKDLLDAAMKRAAETAVYFSHTRPSGADCFSVCKSKMNGENIGAGYRYAVSAVNGWMDSPGHRQNILNESYMSLGVGAVVVNGFRYWVQAFGEVKPDKANASQYKNYTATTKIKFSVDGFSDSDEIFSFGVKGDSSLIVGESGKAELYVNNTFVNVPIQSQYVTYKSQNSSVCKVSGNTYTGTGAGKVKITGTLKDCSRELASLNVTVAARKIPVQELKIKLSPSEFTYNGTERRPGVTVYDKAGKTVSKNDYTVSYPSVSKYPGTYTLKISMKGNYTGSTTKTYKIKKANQKVAVFNRADPGKNVSQVTRRLDSKTLTLGAKVTQGNKTGKFTFRSNNPSVASVTTWGKITFNGVGTAKITAYTKGSANYNSASGTVTLTVLPGPTAITKLQSQESGWLNIQYRANRKADGYQIQYGTSPDMKGARYAAVNNSRIRSYTRKDVQPGTTYYVRVRTFNVVNGTRYYSNWSGIKNCITK